MLNEKVVDHLNNVSKEIIQADFELECMLVNHFNKNTPDGLYNVLYMIADGIDSAEDVLAITSKEFVSYLIEYLVDLNLIISSDSYDEKEYEGYFYCDEGDFYIKLS